jgi:adenine-specific DNA-methyltransferase
LTWPDDYINRVILGDCIEIMRTIPDKSIDAVITDPPWPGCDIDFGIDIKDPYELFDQAAEEIARITGRLIVHLGCLTDPRFLSGVPRSLPFLRACWLRRIPPSFYGSLLYSADVAYVFGHGKLPGNGSRVLGGEWYHSSKPLLHGIKDPRIINHPTPRMIDHVYWLVKWFSRPGDIILDPFCGSGTTLIAAKHQGREFIGIDINPEYVELSQRLVTNISTQEALINEDMEDD